MMNKEKLNELRSQINIPLIEAIALLKQYDDIEQCIQAYHEENIRKISEEIDCKFSHAQSYYQKFGFDLQKIKYHWQKRSFKSCVVLRYDEDVHLYPRVGFTITAEDINLEENTSAEYQEYFIYLEDCPDIMPIFKNIHPISNRRYNIKEQDFDACCRNDFEHATVRVLIERLKEKANNTGSKKLYKFIYLLIECLEQQMKFGHYVVITGNL